MGKDVAEGRTPHSRQDPGLPGYLRSWVTRDDLSSGYKSLITGGRSDGTKAVAAAVGRPGPSRSTVAYDESSLSDDQS